MTPKDLKWAGSGNPGPTFGSHLAPGPHSLIPTTAPFSVLNLNVLCFFSKIACSIHFICVPFFFDLSNPFAETKECNNKISISRFLINQFFPVSAEQFPMPSTGQLTKTEPYPIQSHLLF
jgi:hypothetical protein